MRPDFGTMGDSGFRGSDEYTHLRGEQLVTIL